MHNFLSTFWLFGDFCISVFFGLRPGLCKKQVMSGISTKHLGFKQYHSQNQLTSCTLTGRSVFWFQWGTRVHILNKCFLQNEHASYHTALPQNIPKQPRRREVESSKHLFHLCYWILPCEMCVCIAAQLANMTIRAQLPTVTSTLNVQFAFMKCTFSEYTVLFPFVCEPFVWQSSGCDFVVWANRYDTITSIWPSGATDNVERALQEPHRGETDGLYSCSLL